jgi:hypothetical protein
VLVLRRDRRDDIVEGCSHLTPNSMFGPKRIGDASSGTFRA